MTFYRQYAQNLIVKLSEADYEPLTEDDRQLIITNDTRRVSLYKQESASLCVIHIINADHILEGMRPLSFIQGQYKNVFVVNLFVFDTLDGADLRILDRGKAFTDQPVYELYWAISPSADSVRYNPVQPSDIFGLQRILRAASALSQAPAETSVPDVGTISQIAKEQSPFAELTSNPFVYLIIIVANAVMLYLIQTNGDSASAAVRFGALSPEHVFTFGQYYRLVTSMFVHFGLMHFLYNSFSLMIFGGRVERCYGHIQFSFIYFMSGLVASICSLMFTRSVAGGASGAIFGIIGAAAAYALITGKSLSGLNYYIIVIFLIVGISMGFVTDNIDNYAHIGGLITGMLIGSLYTIRRKHNDTKTKGCGGS